MSVGLILDALKECLGRRQVSSNLLAANDALNEDEEAIYKADLQNDECLLTPLVDSIGYSLNLLKESFLPCRLSKPKQ